MTTATTDLPTLLTAITALENAARYDDALALVDATQVADDRDRLELLMARASVVGRRDYTRGARSAGDHPLDAAQELAARIGTGPTVAWDLAMQHLRRQYADQLVDGIGPAGRDRGRRGRDDGRGRPPARQLRRTTADAAGPACALAGSPTTCAGTGPRRHATTPRRSRPAGPWPTRCWSSRPSGTWATTPTTTATTPGRWRPGRSRLRPRPGAGTCSASWPSRSCSPCSPATPGTRPARRRWPPRRCDGPSSSARPGWPARSPASWPGWTPRLRRRRSPPTVRPPSRILGRLGYGMTGVRATDYRGCMRQDLLVRMRRAG